MAEGNERLKNPSILPFAAYLRYLGRNLVYAHSVEKTASISEFMN